MNGFVEDYMIWTSHGEERNNNAPPHPNPIDEIMQNSDFGAMFDNVHANSSGEGSSDDDGGQGSDGVNDIGLDDGGDGVNDIGFDDDDGYDSSDADELDDSDYLTQLLRNTVDGC